MAFDVLDLNVSKLFKGDDIYVIPRYQRKYVWDIRNWEQLLKDIVYCSGTTQNWSHFIGSMVFEYKGDIEKYIIDGQQRITTLQIIIFALLYKYKEISRDSNISASNKKDCISSIDYLNDLISTKIPGKGKVFKVNNEDAEFQKLNQMALESDESIFSIYDDIINDKKKNKNLFIKAFRYFVKHFNDFKLKDITIFRDQFLNIKIISICSSQDEEVYNIFEILNARGVYLKQVELLKNYMFKYLQPKYLMDTYKKEWMQLEEITEKIDLDDYYLHFLRCYYYKNGMKKEQIFDITKDLLFNKTSKEKHEFYELFIRTGEIYKKIYMGQGDSDVENDVYEYFNLKTNKQIRPVLMSMKIKYQEEYLNQQTYYKLLKYLKHFFIVFNLDGNTSNKIDNDMSLLANNIFKSEKSQEIELAVINFILKYVVLFKDKTVLMQGFKNIAYSNKANKRNISSKLLIYLFKPLIINNEENKYANYDFNTFNIEHVLNDSKEDVIYLTIGNLIPCPEKLNASMKNNDFKAKRERFINSKITFIKNFARQYEQFEKEDIEKRGIDIINLLVEEYSLKYDELLEEKNKLSIFNELLTQLNEAFGNDNTYSKKLFELGTNKFIKYLYGHGSLPEEDKKIIIPIIDQLAS